MSISRQTITKHLSKDKNLIPVIEKIPFPNLQVTAHPLSHALIESIVYQQLSIKAAATIYKRVLDKFKNGELDLLKLSRMRSETLRSAGLSYQKAEYMKNIAKFFLQKEHLDVDWHALSEEELIRRLTVIKGVGVWTVQMILISPMGKLDVFPVQDLGVQQGIVNIYKLTETGKALIHKMHEIAESWRPYRTIVCMYLWRWKDQRKEE